jgi:hypothetical protein
MHACCAQVSEDNRLLNRGLICAHDSIHVHMTFDTAGFTRHVNLGHVVPARAGLNAVNGYRPAK